MWCGLADADVNVESISVEFKLSLLFTMSKSSNSVNSGSIVVQVGQCGNQIGPQLFRSVTREVYHQIL